MKMKRKYLSIQKPRLSPMNVVEYEINEVLCLCHDVNVSLV